LANMQDVLSIHSNSRMDNHAIDKPLGCLRNGEARDAVQDTLLQALHNKPKAEFHHNSLKTDLKDRDDDYKCLIGWPISSYKNKAKVL
jgi:hypothetical protein